MNQQDMIGRFECGAKMIEKIITSSISNRTYEMLAKTITHNKFCTFFSLFEYAIPITLTRKPLKCQNMNDNYP